MAMKTFNGADDAPKSLREIVQKKFLDDVIGASSTWKVLVMDKDSTRVISAALTMYDIMERRVTLVEQLMINRQPFPDMDVIYFVTPNIESARKICDDFPNKNKAKYGNVHLIFTDTIPSDVFAQIQSNALLVSKVKTLKEIYLNFLTVENSSYHFDFHTSLERLYALIPDPNFPAVVGRRLANLCITLNEHPSVRFMGSSKIAQEIASAMHNTLQQFKKSNPTFICNGEDAHHDRERGQILILDRSFDVVTPLMHEYTYQAMANDLLTVEDGVINYSTITNNNKEEERKAILNENDELWVEFRHQHIAKVIEQIKERMNDIIQNNSGAKLAKASGANLDITTMAAAIKNLPEYTQTMSKLGQHVNIASQCMDVFTKTGLLDLSITEQTISTGVDEEGNDVKGMKLAQAVAETHRSPKISKELKIRLIAIYLLVQRNLNSEEFKQLSQAARLNPSELQSIQNFERMVGPLQQNSSNNAAAKTGIFGSLFKGKAVAHAATAEGEYVATRHVCQLKGLLEQLMNGTLPLDKFPSMGPSVSASSQEKAAAKSVRKFGANNRWNKKDAVQYSGGRYIVFIAGGISYPELRAGYELMQQQSKEVVIGGTNFITPDSYMVEIGSLNKASELKSGSTTSSNAGKAHEIL